MIQGDPGPPTQKTLENIRAARTHSLQVGSMRVYWKWWTGSFYVVPWFESGIEEQYGAPFLDEGAVSWLRAYWLTFGYYRTKHLRGSDGKRN